MIYIDIYDIYTNVFIIFCIIQIIITKNKNTIRKYTVSTENNTLLTHSLIFFYLSHLRKCNVKFSNNNFND